MTGAERGFLLLCSDLGDPSLRPLTLAQFRVLSRRGAQMEAPRNPMDEVTALTLRSWGYDGAMAERIQTLLSREEQLDRYLARAEALGITLCTRISPGYPRALSGVLGWEAPPVLALWGTAELLSTPAIFLVGTRDPSDHGAEFAREAGRQAARQGYTLVSGNARGCDRLGEEACFASGGKVIAVVADSLTSHCRGKAPARALFCSEMGFDLPFTSQRALSRNRIIHALGQAVLAVEPRYKRGGTWAGTAENLRKGWSPVFVAESGEQGSLALQALGASMIKPSALSDLAGLSPDQLRT